MVMLFCFFRCLGKQSWIQKIREQLCLFEVLGLVLRYFGPILMDFWGKFPLFSAISRYFTLNSDSMISYLALFQGILQEGKGEKEGDKSCKRLFWKALEACEGP